MNNEFTHTVIKHIIDQLDYISWFYGKKIEYEVVDNGDDVISVEFGSHMIKIELIDRYHLGYSIKFVRYIPYINTFNTAWTTDDVLKRIDYIFEHYIGLPQGG